MSTPWIEIRRLQATLDEVQSSSTSHKLSERNCIEVVTKLMEMGLISVLYTMDGKEYVVGSYLETEIRNELDVHKGRINTVDLQQILNIDLVHIQKAVDNIISVDTTIELIQGELISSHYKETLCCQVNEILLQNGHISLADLSTTFSLPLSYIIPCIETSLGVLIKGHLDKSGSGLLYTESYVSRHKAKIRGTFSAVTRPTPVGPILLRGNYNENLFHSILHELVTGGQLSGTVHGRSDKAIYIPSIYTEMQNEWADNFLTSNGYLEYDAIGRLGITDPHKYIKQRYKSHDLLMLDSCCLATRVISEVDGCVQEEVRRTEKWVDILPILPAPCSSTDANTLLMTKYGSDQSLIIFDSVLSHTQFLRDCQELFKPLLTERAKKAAMSSGSFLRQVSKDKEGVSEGDGSSKRGGKQKKGKSGRRGGREKDEESQQQQQWEMRFMSNTEISRVLADKMEDLPESFVSGLVELLSRPLQQLFQEEAKRLLSEQTEGEAGVQRKRHNVLTQQVQELWNRARLFEKGILKFEGDTKLQLSKYLLKTLCTDMTNMMVSYVAVDNGHKIPEDTPTLNKERSRIIKNLPEPFKPLATDVNGSLSGKDTEEFFVKFEKMCFSDSCGLMLKKLDKKKEKQLMYSHQMTLKDSLKEETDPAMTLHLTVVILFQQTNGCLIHTPGRLLPSILPYLKQGMESNDYQLLSRLYDSIIMQLKTTQLMSTSITSTSLEQPRDTPSGNKDTPSDTHPESSTGTQQQDTPSPAGTTPSPEGDWEMVKSTESAVVEVVGGETTLESLQLLEEVLEEKKEGVSTPSPPLNEWEGQVGKEVGVSGDDDDAVEGVSTENVSKDDVTEDVSCEEGVSHDDQLELLIKSVKEIVLKRNKT